MFQAENDQSRGPQRLSAGWRGSRSPGAVSGAVTAGDGSPAGTVRAADLDDALKLLADADALRAEAAVLVGGLADSGLAQWLGYVSMERLIAHRGDCRNTTARDFVRAARFVDGYPLSAAALREGRLSWANAQTLARAVRGDRAAVFVEYEEQLLAAAEDVRRRSSTGWCLRGGPGSMLKRTPPMPSGFGENDPSRWSWRSTGQAWAVSASIRLPPKS